MMIEFPCAVPARISKPNLFEIAETKIRHHRMSKKDPWDLLDLTEIVDELLATLMTNPYFNY